MGTSCASERVRGWLSVILKTMMTFKAKVKKLSKMLQLLKVMVVSYQLIKTMRNQPTQRLSHPNRVSKGKCSRHSCKVASFSKPASK